ncbi:MAG: YeeE/YedE family protein [Myxococcales bacterium]|nr:YeeE/YedE family protein [Myxococcales bacterium]
MDVLSYLPALAGGLMIGTAAALMLWLEGRIAGISGIVGGLLQRTQGDATWRIAFLLGLIASPLLLMLFTGQRAQVHATVSPSMLVLAGLLVGFGTRLGSGCTSGHGVCGLARRSPRSLVAVATFIATGALTVYFMRHLGGGLR